MPADTPPPDQFWLLTGAVPTGPFTVAQIHAKLSSGEATSQTPACPLGGTAWLPLGQTLGIGLGASAGGTPARQPHPSTPGMQPGGAAPEKHPTSRPKPPPLPPAGTPSTLPPLPPPIGAEKAAMLKAERAGMIGGTVILVLVVVVVGAAGYGLYQLFRPLSATDVCKKLDDAKTAADAKKYATPRMHPLIDAMFADKAGLDPNDTHEWTQEIDGPQPDTKLVGFRGTYFDQEAGQRVRIEGHCRVVKSDGWKVDDMVVTGVEGVSLPGPVSLVDEYRGAAPPPKPPTRSEKGWASRKSMPSTYQVTDTRNWLERNSKVIGGVVFLLFIGAANVFREWRQRRSASVKR